jgi:CheY-like chemotaxis protein
MPTGGRLTIEAQNTILDAEYTRHYADLSPGHYVVLAVSDTGTGMPPEVVERALEPFFTTKPVGKGSGLGLSMVYGFVKQSCGHVTIYSEVDSGSVIKLYLPRTVVPGTGATPEAEPMGRAAETILLVEDDANIRKLVKAMLHSLSYKVVDAEDGPAALSLMAGPLKPDMLLTDMVLPKGMNGSELAREARRRHPPLKVLYMSGYTSNALPFDGTRDTSVRLLSKPFRRQELAQAIRTALYE